MKQKMKQNMKQTVKERLSHWIKRRIPVITMGLMPALALADTGQDKVSSVLRGFIELLTSTPARLIFVIAIIGIGYATIALGKIPRNQAIMIIIGIGVVFSSKFIAQMMGIEV